MEGLESTQYDGWEIQALDEKPFIERESSLVFRARYQASKPNEKALFVVRLPDFQKELSKESTEQIEAKAIDEIKRILKEFPVKSGNTFDLTYNASAGFDLIVKHESISDLVRRFPELSSIMKVYSSDYVPVGLTTVTLCRGSNGEYRTDCRVRGIFVVTKSEMKDPASTKAIKQDYLVEWFGGRKPAVTYYSGQNARLKALAATLKDVQFLDIKEFCKEFGQFGQYGCPPTPTHWYTKNDPNLPGESEWQRAFAEAVSKATSP